jgi:hypothetical protein
VDGVFGTADSDEPASPEDRRDFEEGGFKRKGAKVRKGFWRVDGVKGTAEGAEGRRDFFVLVVV